MFQHILVPLDGSTRAERAIPVAARIARASSGEAVLLRVVGPSWEFSPSSAPPLPSASTQMLIEIERAEASSYLARLATSKEFTGVQTVTEVIAGSPAATILSVADTHQCDLIVLCRHGYTSTTTWRLGSVAGKITRHAPLSVLLLNDERQQPFAQDPGSERLLCALVPVDGSPQAEAALVPAAGLIVALAGPARGALHLIQVVKLPSTEDTPRYQAYTHGGMKERMEREASAYLNMLADRLKETLAGHQPAYGNISQGSSPFHVSITWSVVFAADVAEVLMRAAENEARATSDEATTRCDLIAMSTRGRGEGSLWSLGSVTERVLQAAKLSVLLVRQ